MGNKPDNKHPVRGYTGCGLRLRGEIEASKHQSVGSEKTIRVCTILSLSVSNAKRESLILEQENNARCFEEPFGRLKCLG